MDRIRRGGPESGESLRDAGENLARTADVEDTQNGDEKQAEPDEKELDVSVKMADISPPRQT